MRGLSVFSGIGGLDVAAVQAGVQVVAMCEIDPWCRTVLRKRFGEDVVLYDDIKTITAQRLAEDGVGGIDLLFGGPPCQPASAAGKRRGADDDRWLWPEFLRLLGDLKPRWVVAENPTGILSVMERRGFGDILRAMADLGYDAAWCTYGASAVGAPHRRERIFITARRQRGVGQANATGGQGGGLRVL